MVRQRAHAPVPGTTAALQRHQLRQQGATKSQSLDARWDHKLHRRIHKPCGVYLSLGPQPIDEPLRSQQLYVECRIRWNTVAPFDTLKPTASLAPVPEPPAGQETTPQVWFKLCMATPPTPDAQGNDQAFDIDNDISGASWSAGLVPDTRYCHVMPPNTWGCRGGVEMSHDASSRHPGIVNVAFLDGSVKSIKSSVNIATWWALGTRSGGEVISSDSY